MLKNGSDKPFQGGLTIAIEGPDGVGKTTQLELLARYFKEQGLSVHTTRASGGTPIGKALREVSLSDHPRSAETDLYISHAMFTSLAEDIEHQRADSQVILIDRSPLTILAYNAFGSQLKDKQPAFEACERYVRSWKLDTLIFLDAPQELIDSRRDRRHKKTDYFEKQGAEYRQRVRDGYEAGVQYVEALSDQPVRIIKINASSDVDTIHNHLVQKIADTAPAAT